MPENILRDLSDSLKGIVEAAAHTVAMVGSEEGAPRSAMWISDDELVTVARSAEPGETVSVWTPGGQQSSGTVAGYDATSGIALLTAREPAGRAVAMPNDSPAPAIGSVAVSVAYPSSDGLEARFGIIRCVGTETRLSGGRRASRYFQTDSPAFPGFLGAPLLDADGALLGINMGGSGWAIQDSSAFALPADELARIIEQLRRKSYIGVGYLGVETKAAPVPEGSGVAQERGLLVTEVDAESAAKAAGVRVGDMIISVNGAPVQNVENLVDALLGTNESEIDLSLLRGERLETLRVTPGTRRGVSEAGRQEDEHGRGRMRAWGRRFRAQMRRNGGFTRG